MARLPSQTLIRSSTTNPLKLLGISQPNRFSSRSGNHRLLEIDVESSCDSEVDVLALRRFDDVIHNIIVKQSTPDWIPFVPGSSYWVPPIHKHQTDELYHLLKTLTHPSTFDQVMVVSSSPSRGWPSSAYFIQGTHPMHPVDVNADKNRENVFRSEDEEG